ncbi:unnamed protein product [Ambrosiozyma monospora]|uniref:Unnamed protein product n=1 Tax=Ambrosiozyma monospora TaxID=43982 RepID=A0ACB5SRX0_AMBMO|nr:unnamed protein product [Ambrosiozyma monospora]
MIRNQTNIFSNGLHDSTTSIESAMNNGSRSWSVYECGDLCTNTLSSLYHDASSELPDDNKLTIDKIADWMYSHMVLTASSASSSPSSFPRSYSISMTDSTITPLSNILQADIFKTYYIIALCAGFQEYIQTSNYGFDVYLLTNTADDTVTSLYDACRQMTTVKLTDHPTLCDNIKSLT